MLRPGSGHRNEARTTQGRVGAPLPRPAPQGDASAVTATAAVAGQAESGRAARRQVPRRSHAHWAPASDRPDSIALLEEQAESRDQTLVPIRHGRMAASAFAFFRGAAYVMAADLAETPTSGITVQLCGDAHLSNFGGFAAPDRQLVFDLNDFDETLPGPWEWDVKRLAASIEVAGRARNFGRKQRGRIVRRAVAEYREAMRRFAEMRDLDVWYARLDAPAIVDVVGQQVSQKEVKRLRKAGTKARSKDSIRALERL